MIYIYIMDYRLVIKTHNNVCKFIYWIVLSNILRIITIHYLDEQGEISILQVKMIYLKNLYHDMHLQNL